VLVVYNSNRVSYEELLKAFFERHDPTHDMRQGNDVGTQYRSGIYFTSEARRRAAEAAKRSYDQALREKGFDAITTEILPASAFYFAQDLAKNPLGYFGLGGTVVPCQIGTGVSTEV